MAELVNSYTMLMSTLILVIIIRWLINYAVRMYRLPPGPWGIPILGYLPWISKKPYKDFMELGKKYGGMFSLQFGPETVVVLNDWPSVKATLADQPNAFSGRKQNPITYTFSHGKDISFGDGPIWKKQRNLAIQGLRNVGMSRKSIEGHLTNMLQQMLDKLQQQEGQTIVMEELIEEFIIPYNWKLLSSFEVAGTPEKMATVKHDINVFLHGLRHDNPIGALPWLRFFPPNGFGHWNYEKSINRFRQYLQELIDKHRAQLDGENENDFIDFYIRQININGTGKPPYNDEYMMGAMVDVVIGAIETVISTILWAFLNLAMNPQIQKRVQEELDTVIGRQRLPCYDDLNQLPYLNAFTMENNRLASIVPLSVPHATTENAHVNGYVIPKGTMCLQNIYGIHRDPDLWEEPESFKPERYLDADGKLLPPPPYYIPFSLGPRICLGQSLAEVEMRFLYAQLLHQFNFNLPENLPKPTMEPVHKFTLRPHFYSLKITSRNN